MDGRPDLACTDRGPGRDSLQSTRDAGEPKHRAEGKITDRKDEAALAKSYLDSELCDKEGEKGGSGNLYWVR